MSVNKKEVQFASVLVMIIGVGYLFPFSALTQPIDYWHKVFPDFNVEFPMTTCYMWVNLVALGFMVFRSGEPSFTFRIVGGFVGQFLVLVFVPSLHFLHLSETWNYYCIMFAAGMAAISTSMIDSVAISLVAQYPRRLQVSLQFGIGLSTLIGSVYRLLTKAVFPPSEVVQSSLLYFYCGAVTIFTGVFAFYWLISLPISRRCLKYGMTSEYTAIVDSGPEEETFRDSPIPEKGSVELPRRRKESFLLSGEDSDSDLRVLGEASLLNAAMKHTSGYNTNDRKSLTTVEDGFADSPVLGQRVNRNEPDDNDDYSCPVSTNNDGRQPDKRDIFWRVLYGEWLVFLVYFVSLALWPPLITEIRSFNFPQLQATQWWPLLMLFLFSVMDCLGRLLTPYRWIFTRATIHWVVYGRILLAPLLICSAKGWYFTNDAFSVLFIALLGVTNGYGGSLSIIMLNETVDDFEKGAVGMFTGFFLNLGLVFGATASLGLEKILAL